ncbi:MAG: leucine--tRNA ligase [Pseudomonadota bacterium]
MQAEINVRAVERDAQAYWHTHASFAVSEDSNKPKYYCLSMLPYPSGKLHMGHVRNYTIGDVISRYRRMNGYNVLQPMGWDAFGMPAENAAIERGRQPAEWTYANIDYMKQQMQALGFGFDWAREVTTCKPDYYRWEQWFFTELLKRGDAYRKNGEVNWCETDQTVLANEQVEDGCCWRCGNPVERREIAQWYLRITDYAQELLDGLDTIDWPDMVKTMQRNWIGRSEGVEFDWSLPAQDATVRVYTTRPDTIMGVTFMAVAAEHPVAQAVAEQNPAVAAFIAECKRTGTSEAVIEKLEKKGMALGVDVTHPVSGQPVPVWVGNYVLMSYGGGAVMGVPGHDQRDHDFARTYGIPIVQVVDAADGSVNVEDEAFITKGDTVLVNSGAFDGLDHDAALAATADYLVEHANGERKVNYRMRDWLVSRQRYWGTPIPVVYDAAGEAYPVPAEDLPVVLPEDVHFEGVTSPLQKDEAFLGATLPDGTPGRRETDTFDTFFQSSWYYARYCCPGANGMLDERANHWLSIDQYIGGIEHAVMHLLYFRYFHKLMRDMGLVDSDEPALRYLPQGMVVSETFYREDTAGKKTYFAPNEVALSRDSRGAIVGATLLEDGDAVTVGKIQKMSKSKNNGVDPQEMIDRYGADTVRLFTMFASPPDQSLEWKEAGVEGMHRFIKRLWRAVHNHVTEGGEQPVAALDVNLCSDDDRALRAKTHSTIKKVSDDIGRRYTFNTAIAAVMELVNEIGRFKGEGAQAHAVVREALQTAVALLSPITPHTAHALWPAIGGEGAAVDIAWPEADESALVADTVSMVVQVNGKVRGQIEVPTDTDNDTIEQTAKAEEGVQRHLEGKTVRKVIVVKGRLVNIVVG